MKILLVNPPFLPKFSRSSRSPAVPKGGTLYYPLWLAYATGVLEKEGHDCKLVDAPAQGLSRKDILKVVKKFKPEVVVLDTSTPSIYNDVEVLEEIKAKHDCFAVLVGTHVSALPLKTMKLSDKIDAIAIKEYDYTLRELAKELGKKKPVLKKVKGLVFKSGKKIVNTGVRKPIENLDDIPFASKVYKKHLNHKNYFYSANLWPEITIVTGRGCPFNCLFCNWVQNLNPGKYRTRSITNVIEEFKYIEKEFPEVKEVFLEDDTFTADFRRVKEFCKKKIDAGIKVKWSCNARADVPLDVLKLMKRAGCRLLCVGFESGSQAILNKARKGTIIPRIEKFMQDAKKAGVLVHGCFMVGNIGETTDTARQTVEFAKRLNPDSAQFFPIMVYPGTGSYEYFKKQGWLITEDYSKWLDSEGSHNCMVSTPQLSNNELVRLCDEGRRAFYLRPNYMTGKALQIVKTPEEARRILKSAFTLAKYLLRGSKGVKK
ncbi:MAG: B12-binding domain-containing radical SAM protein [Candidatus Diapherotrites archaeon]|uniref:B12-binding domain-containing radical SAM protein n=1 Tax=Candidatus Iainarchaeum sp. TaxID=3101447 RepID=A0A2D6M016_9ARCH|nr:B12-binding domain-containing radical SAM protein [Candidatus Diapherotrites archaeon]|tara:strand:+ start:3176 stop:4636 length:1461 start_codon:yes stop_codon:yes gene_type:complete